MIATEMGNRKLANYLIGMFLSICDDDVFLAPYGPQTQKRFRIILLPYNDFEVCIILGPGPIATCCSNLSS